MEDTIMDSHPEGQISSSPISSSTVPNGSTASNSSSSSSSRSGDTTSQSVFEVDENQMDVDQQSSSSSITASVPVAPISSSHQMSNDNVSAGNVHQNGYRNGSIEQGGTGANSRLVMNGNLSTNNSSQIDISTTPEDNVPQRRSLSVVSNPERFNRLIVFGRQLQAMLQDLETSQGVKTDKNTKMLQDAFALLAYPNPWESPVGWQLESTEREFVSSSLNSAILESQCNQPGRPPLQVSLTHAKQLIKLMANNDLGACAFADVDDFLK